MNEKIDNTGTAEKPALTLSRRSILAGVAMMATPSMVAAAPAPYAPTIDDWLAKATPAERVKYHTDALTEAMAEMHPEYRWRQKVEHDANFILVVASFGEVRS